MPLELFGCNRQNISDCKLMVKGHRFWKFPSQALSTGRMISIPSFQTVSGLARQKDQFLLRLLVPATQRRGASAISRAAVMSCVEISFPVLENWKYFVEHLPADLEMLLLAQAEPGAVDRL